MLKRESGDLEALRAVLPSLTLNIAVQRWLDWQPKASSMGSKDKETSPRNSNCKWDDLCRSLFFSADEQLSLKSELECMSCRSEVK